MRSVFASAQGLLDQQLAELKDIHLPRAPDFALQTPGWLLLVILVFALILAVFLWYLYRPPWILTKQAIRELNQLYEKLGSKPELAEQLTFAEDCKKLLKRRARVAYPETKPEVLTGNEWRDFLMRTSTGGAPPDILISGLYAPNPEVAPADIKSWVERWLRRQRLAR